MGQVLDYSKGWPLLGFRYWIAVEGWACMLSWCQVLDNSKEMVHTQLGFMVLDCSENMGPGTVRESGARQN